MDGQVGLTTDASPQDAGPQDAGTRVKTDHSLFWSDPLLLDDPQVISFAKVMGMSRRLQITAADRLKSAAPFGLGHKKPKHFRDMMRVAWANRDNLGSNAA